MPEIQTDGRGSTDHAYEPAPANCLSRKCQRCGVPAYRHGPDPALDECPHGFCEWDPRAGKPHVECRPTRDARTMQMLRETTEALKSALSGQRTWVERSVLADAWDYCQANGFPPGVER